MSQIDYFLKFVDRATALADALVALSTFTDEQGVKQLFKHSCMEPFVWRNSQDTTSVDANGNTVITHTPIAGYVVLASFPRIIPALLNHSAVLVVWDRDLMNARHSPFILKSAVTNAVLQDLRSTVFAGTDAPWGALN